MKPEAGKGQAQVNGGLLCELLPELATGVAGRLPGVGCPGSMTRHRGSQLAWVSGGDTGGMLQL